MEVGGGSLYGPFTFVYRFSLCTLAQPLEVRQFYHYYRPSSCRKVFNSFWEKGQGVSIWPLPVPIQTWSLGDNPLALALHTGTLTALVPLDMFKLVHLDLIVKGPPPHFHTPPIQARKWAVGLWLKGLDFTVKNEWILMNYLNHKLRNMYAQKCSFIISYSGGCNSFGDMDILELQFMVLNS